MKKQYSVISITALAVASILTGCASDKKQTTAAAPPAPAPVEQAAAPQTRPGGAAIEGKVVNATVKAIDKKNRVVTVKFPDGKEKKVKCGPEVINFPQIRVGDDVKAEFVEYVELFIADSPEKPSAGHTSEMKRAPKGSKPGVEASETVEMKSTVEAINYDTREVTLRGPDGEAQKTTVGPEMKRFNEVKQGDTVVARITRSVSIKVSTPAKK